MLQAFQTSFNSQSHDHHDLKKIYDGPIDQYSLLYVPRQGLSTSIVSHKESAGSQYCAHHHSFTIHFYSRSQVLYPNIFQAPSGWSETRSKVYDCFEFTRCDTTWHMSCWERSKLKTSRLRLFAWGISKKKLESVSISGNC